MKVSLSWLKQYLPDLDVPGRIKVTDLADRLTMLGLEVEALVDRFGFLETVRVGRVVSAGNHPDASHLKICRVDIRDRVLSIVCGAPNVREGIKAPVALPGTLLPDGRTLEAGRIRGEISEGMLASEAELGLGVDASGIMLLDADAPVGAPVSEALGLEDYVLEIGLTPNRPDCLAILGIAREVAAAYGLSVRYPEIPAEGSAREIGQMTSVTIEAPDLCPRYAARLLTGITVAPSPHWLKERLRSVGLRPINNVVDITNFVMLETGQPLHAFDFDRLEEHRIVVRTAGPGERFVTLDQKERVLAADMLMICDGKKPVAVAGVMGGLNSEIEAATSRVLIESACFQPASIRRTAKRLGLATDASHRFERGVDPDVTVRALDRAAALMAEVCGGVPTPGIIDEHPRPAPVKTISLGVERTNRMLGTRLGAEEIQALLAALSFDVRPRSDAELAVTVPSFRVDVSRPEDLMEEVARLWGYNRIPTTFPQIPAKGARPNARQALRDRMIGLLTGFGFAEAIHYSFISHKDSDRLRLSPEDPRRRTVTILNPLTEEQDVMRTSLIPGLLGTMRHNLSQQVKTLRLFEIGRVYLGQGGDAQPRENEMVAGLWTGLRVPGAWYAKETPCDFYDLKGVVEGLLDGLGITGVRFTALPADGCAYTAPGQAARILMHGRPAGLIGAVHKAVLEAFDLKQPAFVFELEVEGLQAALPASKTARPLPRFPAVARDATLILPQEQEVGAILQAVDEVGEALVEEVALFDVYAGAPIPEGKKSISLRITYRSAEGTLEVEAVNALHGRITAQLIEKFGAVLPG